jgi:hypothetical protein
VPTNTASLWSSLANAISNTNTVSASEDKGFMKVLKYISDVVSGKIKRHNTTEGVVVNDLWQTAERMGHPNNIVFKEFIVSSGIVTDLLIWEVREPGISKIVSIDMRKIIFSINQQQIRELYSILLAYFVYKFSKTFGICPSWRKEIEGALGEVISSQKPEVDLIGFVKKLGGVSPNSGYAEDSVVLDVMAKIIGLDCECREDPRLLVWFGLMLQACFNDAVKGILDEYDFSSRVVSE